MTCSWDERLKMMAKYVPENSTVLDVGSGKKLLKGFIPVSCEYNCLDLQEANYTFDLNKISDKEWGMIDLYSHIVCSGVIEYIEDVPNFVKHIVTKGDVIILSYAGIELNEPERPFHGWLNNYRILDIVAMFLNENFELIRINEWKTQTIMVFHKETCNGLQ